MAYDIIDTNNPGFVPPFLNSKNVINPITINGYSALTIPAYKCAVSFLANNLASLPRGVYKDGGKLDVPHPIDTILKRKPNQYQTSYSFWTTWFFHAVHKKAGYAKIVRSGADITGIYNLDPDTIIPFRVIPEGADPESGEQWFYDQQYKRVIPTADMLYLHGLSADGQTAFDPCELGCDTLQRAKSYDRYALKYIQKGTMIKAWVKLPADATEDQQAQIVATLRQFKGANSDDDLAVLSGGAELHNSTLSPVESQLTGQVAISTKQIAQMTGVPPEMLFESSEAKYNNNLDQMKTYIVQFTLRPWIESAEDELCKLLSTEDQANGLDIRLNVDAMLRGDSATQSNIVVQQVTAGIRSKNEGRELLGLPDDPNPSSNQLHTLGDNAPPVPQSSLTNNSAVDAPDGYGTVKDPPGSTPDGYERLKPLLIEASARVERKTSKAFEGIASKSQQEKTIWGNVFAEQQARYVNESFTALAVSWAQLGGTAIDISKLSEQYATEIKKRVAGSETKPLSDYLGEQINGK